MVRRALANGNTCTITVGNVATFFSTQAMALDASKVIVKMKDGSGTTTCNPVSSCNSTATQFPSASYNSVGSDITITATYGVKSPLAMFWPPRHRLGARLHGGGPIPPKDYVLMKLLNARPGCSHATDRRGGQAMVLARLTMTVMFGTLGLAQIWDGTTS